MPTSLLRRYFSLSFCVLGFIGCLWLTPFLGAEAAIAAIYYVRPGGNDALSGTSPEKAWKTLARVNAARFFPGDRILLAGGGSFAGTLRLGPQDRGSPREPITIASYGDGPAIVDAGTEAGIVVRDAAGYVIRNLRIQGAGRTVNHSDGIRFINDLEGDAKLEFIRIYDVEVSGFGEAGISIRGERGKSGYRDVLVVDSIAHDNGRAGLWVDGKNPYANENVQIIRTIVFRNSGIPGARIHTGDGILLGSVDGGLIEGSVAHDNGWLCNAPLGGAVGIWTYQSRRMMIQNNLSFHNRTGGPRDGGGFGLDGGVTESVLQFNRSFENDGAGYGLFNYTGALPWGSNVVRHNSSRDDGRKNNYGAVTLYSEGPAMGSVEIMENEIRLSGGDPTKAIRFWTDVPAARLCGNKVTLRDGRAASEASNLGSPCR